jgi:transcriptional regulator with XRE-family HTH domain
VETLSSQLGRVIRRRRLAAGLSQEGLAERAALHRNYVGLVERGERNVTVDALARIAAGLGVPLSRLVAEAEAGEPSDPDSG